MIYTFGQFEFDAEHGQLRKNGRLVALEPQPAKVLAWLLSRAGEIVTRDELREVVWGRETHVDFDRGLAYCLSHIRTALGDSGENPRFVQTLPKRGYKFIAPIATPAAAATFDSAQGSGVARVKRWRVATMIAAPLILLMAVVAFLIGREPDTRDGRVVIAVSMFDNETGLSEYDRLVAGLADVVVASLTNLAPDNIAIVGNATVLRQPRNIRNLEALADSLDADYVVLGQRQRDEAGLRFITHFIRLSDLAHLKANRLRFPDGNVFGLESAVVAEFERAVREHVLTRSGN
jgi:DNA-binding winged helix-turn-helix (wHTH) protein/TolB-like protein